MIIMQRLIISRPFLKIMMMMMLRNVTILMIIMQRLISPALPHKIMMIMLL